MTRGPWLVYESLVGDAAVLQVRAGSNGAGEIVAEVGPVGDPRAKEDACAIACTPDLVELAQDLLLHTEPDLLRERARRILGRMRGPAL